MTEKLYWLDAFADSFAVERGALAEHAGKPSIVLEKTAFYPEAGGQLGDRGTLQVGDVSLAVVDTQIAEDGTIHHVLADAPPADVALALARSGVRGTIDRERRAAQRIQHTAQHMLSRALLDVATAATASARLGNAASTIDLEIGALGDADVARAEDLVNAVVRDDLAVDAFFPSPAELAELPLRRAPKVDAQIRVITVGERGHWFDVTPCGGTHVRRTGQLGAIRITALERYKGMMRVTFLAGGRVVEDAREKDAALGGLARELSCGPLDVPHAVAKLRTELKSARDAAQKLTTELVALEGERLLAQHPARARFTPIVVVREGADITLLRLLAGKLASRADVVAVVCDGAAIVVQRGESASFDCGAWLKRLAASAGGRGGGSPARAEGRLTGAITRELLENALGVAEA